jgi:hypothetical protein
MPKKKPAPAKEETSPVNVAIQREVYNSISKIGDYFISQKPTPMINAAITVAVRLFDEDPEKFRELATKKALN